MSCLGPSGGRVRSQGTRAAAAIDAHAVGWSTDRRSPTTGMQHAFDEAPSTVRRPRFGGPASAANDDTKMPRGIEMTTVGRLGLAAVLLAALASGAACGAGASGEATHGTADDVGADAQLSVKDEFTAIAEGLEASNHPYVGRAQIPPLWAEIAGLGGELDRPTVALRRATLQGRLSTHLLRVGDVEEALALADAAWEAVERLPAGEPPTPDAALQRRRILNTRAQAYLRSAEVENCIERHNRDCCIFPIQGGGVHAVDAPARKALSIYMQLAAEEPENLSHRWMCNILAMALGEHPDALPDELVIPSAAFDSELDIGRFHDVAVVVGADVFGLAGGTAVDDYDGDGLLDVAISDSDPRGRLTILLNDGRGGYRDASVEAGVADQLGGLNLVSSDYDSDGDADLYVLRGSWLLGNGRIRDSLLQNDGKARFTDVTRAAGVAEPASPTHSAAFGDYDGDGDVDLYVGSEAYRDEETLEHHGLPSHVFLNDGDGSFSRSGEAPNERYCKGVAAGDYDNDGDLDLYVSNIGDGELGINRLYRNDGAAHFDDVAQELGVDGPNWSFTTWFFDFDNDGWLDIFLVGYDAKVADLAAHHLGRPDGATRPRLYRNEGGRFRDVAKEAGLDRPLLPMGGSYGDFDNDGWLDVYLGTGNPNYEVLMPNVALRNDGGKRFQDVTSSGGFGHLQKGHGVAFADLDNDGDQDVYHDLGGFNPGDGFANALFENPGHGNHFLELELEGTVSNRPAIGARVRVIVETPDGEREIHRAVGSVSSFGSGQRRQEIGLGDARRIAALEIRWPRTGELQRFEDVPLDRLVRVVEGARELEVRELRPAPFREKGPQREAQ